MKWQNVCIIKIKLKNFISKLNQDKIFIKIIKDKIAKSHTFKEYCLTLLY